MKCLSNVLVVLVGAAAALLLAPTTTNAFVPSSPIGTTGRTTKLLQSFKNTADSNHNDNDVVQQQERRSFVATCGVGILATLVGPAPPSAVAADTTTVVDYKAVSADIGALIDKNPDWAPTLVRLAWHSSGTYDKISKTGGSSGGTIRFADELAHGGNAGLAVTAVKWLEPIYQKYNGLSYADLYTLAGVTSIAKLGGPIIPWSSGRVDTGPETITPDGRLPNADSGPALADPHDASHLRTIFGRMGFNDQEIVALSGAHALGRCHTNASGYDGPWTPTPTVFNNAYFTLLQNLQWTPKENWSGPPQYVDAPTGKLMMLPTDLVLLQDPKFAKWVKVYAKDGPKFNADFAKVFQKLEELGTSGLTPTEWV